MLGLMILALLAFLTYLNALTVKLLRRRKAGAGWWCALIAFWLAGSGLGVWSGFFFEYRPKPDLRVFGAPVPGAFLHREGPPGEEQWVDFITPAPLLFAGSNIALLGLLAALPVWLLFLLRGMAWPGHEASKHRC